MLDLTFIEAFMHVQGLSIIILSPSLLLFAILLLLPLGQYLFSGFLVLGCIV